MEKAFTNFEDSDVGAVLPSGWTRRDAADATPADYSFLVENGTPLFKRREMQIVCEAADDFPIATFDPVELLDGLADLEIVFLYERPASNSLDILRAFLRGFGSSTFTDGYFLDVDHGGDVLQFNKRIGSGTPSAVGSSVAYEHAAGERHIYRVRVNGTGATVDLKVNAWPAGTTEPEGWILEETDSSAVMVSGGWSGLCGYAASGSKSAIINFFAARANGGTAVLPRLNADYQAVIRNPANCLAVLAELIATGFDPVNAPYTKEISAYLTDGENAYQSHEQDTPSSQQYEPIIIQAPTFSRKMGEALRGEATVGLGDLSIDNSASPQEVKRSTLKFDFAQSLIDARRGLELTVTNGNGTRVNELGLIVGVAPNTLRPDYHPITKAFRGILREEARTNHAIHNTALQNAAWGKSQVVVNANQALGPDGTMSMDEVLDDATAASAHILVGSGSWPAAGAGNIPISIFVKDKTGDRNIMLEAKNYDNDFYEVIVNPVTGAVTVANGSPVAQGAEYWGNGIWFAWMVIPKGTGGATPFYDFPLCTGTTLGSATYSGNSTSGLYLYGPQFEQGDLPSSLIITGAAAKTRAADLMELPTSGWLNAVEGTMVVTATPSAASAAAQAALFSVHDGTLDERITVNTSPANYSWSVFDGGGIELADSSGVAVAPGVPATVAVFYKANDFGISANGSTLVTDTSGALPTVTTLELGSVVGLAPFNGHIRSFEYYPQRRTNPELVVLSAGGALLEYTGRGVRDDWTRIKWKRTSVRILLGQGHWPRHDFRTVVLGRLEQPVATEDSRITFRIKDLSDILEVPLQANLYSVPSELANQTKPMMMADVDLVEPPQIDLATQTYQVHDGEIQLKPLAFYARVFDNDDELYGGEDTITAVNAGTNTLSVAAPHGMVAGYRGKFVAGTPPSPLVQDVDYYVVAAGLTTTDFRLAATHGGSEIDLTTTDTGATFQKYGWREDLSNGTISLAANPAGRIFVGNYIVPGVRTPAEGLDWIIFTKGGISRNYQDLAAFAALTTALGSSTYAGRWAAPGETLSVRQAAVKFCEGILGWSGITPDGLIQVGRISLPTDTPVMSFTESDVLGGSLSLATVMRPIDMASSDVTYAPKFFPKGPLQAAGGDFTQLLRYEARVTYTDPPGPADIDDYPAAADMDQGRRWDTCFAATGEAARLQDLYLKMLGIFQFTVPHLGPSTLSIGETISLSHPRLGWKEWSVADPSSPDSVATIDSRLAVVLGTEVDLSSKQTKITVVRQIPGNYPFETLS